jgi:murein DD-endopeptidase MepM/ murein hydrolase activator NlpD
VKIRHVATAVIIAVVILALPAAARIPTAAADGANPGPCASPPASGAPSAPPATGMVSGERPPPPPPTCATPDPTQTQYQQLEQRLGGDLARALTLQQQLNDALDQTSATELVLSDRITAEEDRIAELEDQIAQLDTQIDDTQSRIDVEKSQLATLTRAIYREPDSLFMEVLRTGNLGDALVETANMVVAGQRAHDLQSKLQADLAKLQADRAAKLAALDAENSTHDSLLADMSTLDDVLSRQGDLISQLDDVMSQIQDAQAQLQDQPPDVTAEVAQLIEQEEQDVVTQSNQAAWIEASVRGGLAVATHQLPAGHGPGPLRLSWPVSGAVLTQPFGPSSLAIEPAFGGYPHFHTGDDLAAPLGTPVSATANGVVVAVQHSSVGYGNLVIVAHGYGTYTLYAHLLETDVKVGEKVVRGQIVGLLGSTGWSTGPHVHFEVRIDGQPVDPMRFLPPA